MTDQLTVEEAVALLDAIRPGDPEYAHSRADTVLIRAAHPLVADAWERAADRTGPWWYA